MKIQFVGKKKLLSVRLPIDAHRKDQTSVVHFNPGDVHTFDDDTGKKLISLNPSGIFVEIKGEEEPGPKVLEETDVEAPKKKRGRPRKVAE